jgi:hypothetical protein
MAEPWAEATRAQIAAEAISTLLAASRKRTRTVQWMPEWPGCRFEVIDARSGDLVDVVRIDAEGRLSRPENPEGEGR